MQAAITTGLSTKQIVGRYGGGIACRILEGATVVRFSGATPSAKKRLRSRENCLRITRNFHRASVEVGWPSPGGIPAHAHVFDGHAFRTHGECTGPMIERSHAQATEVSSDGAVIVNRYVFEARPALLTVDKLTTWGLERGGVEKLIATGKLRSVRIGRKTCVVVDDLIALATTRIKNRVPKDDAWTLQRAIETRVTRRGK